MATKKIKSINDNTKKILSDSSTKKIVDDAYEELRERADYVLSSSNEILREISFISGEDEFERKEDLLNSFNRNKKRQRDMVTIDNFLSLSDYDMEKYIPIISQIKHNYYSIKNSLLEIELSIASYKINNAIDQTNDVSGKLENIVGLIISIILSVTIVTTSIAALDNMKQEFIPLYIVSMVWLGMTLFAFCASLFNHKKYNSTATVLYAVVSSLELAVLLATMMYLYVK